MNQTTVPTTWSALLLQNAPLLDMSLDSLRDTPSYANGPQNGARANDTPAARSLLGASQIVAQAAIVRGSEGARASLEILVPLISTAVRELDGAVKNANGVRALSVLSLINVAQCCGVSIPNLTETEISDVQHRWYQDLVHIRKSLSDVEHVALALAIISTASSVDIDKWVPELLGGVALSDTFVPQQTFAFDTPQFVRYLAVAVQTQQPLSAVLPALQDFIAHFPHKLAAGRLNWDELLFAGRIVFAVLGKESVSVVADAMYASVTAKSFEGGL